MSEALPIDLRRCLVQSLLVSAMQMVMFQPGYLIYMSTQDPRLVPLQALVRGPARGSRHLRRSR